MSPEKTGNLSKREGKIHHAAPDSPLQQLAPLQKTPVSGQRLSKICVENDLVVWGVCLDDGAFEQHMRYVRDVSLIRTDLVMELPHLRPLKREWEHALKVEEKSFRKAEAGYNKRMKYKKRSQSPKD